MADKKDNNSEASAVAREFGRPVRPFLAGVGIGAAWGAFHLPVALFSVAAGGFAAEVIAVGILAGGLIAALMEGFILLAVGVPRLLSFVSRRS